MVLICEQALAKARNYFMSPTGADRKAREEIERSILVEEYSTDSFQNVLFSLMIYYKHMVSLISRYQASPQERYQILESVKKEGPLKTMHIVSHRFKSRRFMELHVPTLKLSRTMVRFTGINPPMTDAQRRQTFDGERERGYKPWQHDSWGRGSFLDGKRKWRGWDETAILEEVLSEGWEGADEWKEAFRQAIVGRHNDCKFPWEQQI